MARPPWESTLQVVQQVEVLQLKRIFIDSVTQLCYLAVDEFQFHKQILSFLRFLQEKDTTVLLTVGGGCRTRYRNYVDRGPGVRVKPV